MTQMCPRCGKDNSDTGKFCAYCRTQLQGLLGTRAILQQNRYEVVRLLGCGGMGAVYLALDHRLGDNRVAAKENLDTLPQAQAQFQREANVLASLSHPNLPKVIDHFVEHTGRQYLVMEYVDGENLETLVEQRGALPVAQVLDYADAVLDALIYLHERPQPIIHRDIKPSNIKLTAEGKIKLVDFGLVKIFDAAHAATSTSLRGLATPEYAPMEQYSGTQHTDQRSDIYALGATLYHLLIGQAPPMAMLRSAKPESFIKPTRVNPSIPLALEKAILKAMEPQMDKRFQSAREMRQALQGVKPKPTWVWVAAGVAIVVILGLMIAMWGQQTGQGPFGFLLATATATASVTPNPTATSPTTVTSTVTKTPAPTTSVKVTATPVSINTATATLRPVVSPRPTKVVPTAAPTASPCPEGQFWNPVMNRCQSTFTSPLPRP